MDSRDDFALIFTTLYLVFKTKISFLVKFDAFRDDTATGRRVPYVGSFSQKIDVVCQH